MDIDHDHEIHYEENNKIIHLINTNHQFWAIIIKDNQLFIEVHYDKSIENMSILNGTFGTRLNNANLSTHTKLERVVELFHNELWNYRHQIIGKQNETN